MDGYVSIVRNFKERDQERGDRRMLNWNLFCVFLVLLLFLRVFAEEHGFYMVIYVGNFIWTIFNKTIFRF